MDWLKLILFQEWSLSGEKMDLENYQLSQLALMDIWAISVFYISTASVSLETWHVIKGNRQLHLFSEFSDSLGVWSLHCQVKFTKILEKLLFWQAQQPKCSHLRTSHHFLEKCRKFHILWNIGSVCILLFQVSAFLSFAVALLSFYMTAILNSLSIRLQYFMDL